jgi:hypothetical protein
MASCAGQISQLQNPIWTSMFRLVSLRRQKKCAKRAKSARSPLLMCLLADHGRSAARFRQAERCLAHGHRAGGREPLSPGQSRRQTGRYLRLRATDWRTSRLSSGVRVVWPRAGDRWCGVFQLSKLLNQEDALSAPCLRGDFCSPQAPRGSAGILRKGLIRRF